MSRLLRFVWVFFLLWPVAHGVCDDAAYMGDGADVFPISDEDIRLVSEQISVSLADEGNPVKDWRVDVTMHFQNMGPAKTVQMGFPFGVYHSREDTEYTEMPNDIMDPGFRTWVDGRAVPTTVKRGVTNPRLKDMYFPVVYTFEVPFASGEQKTIYHTYKVGGLVDSMGYKEFSYILRTGSLWRGTIGRANMTFATHVLQAGALRADPKPQRTERQGEREIWYWTFTDLEPSFDIEIKGDIPGKYKEASLWELGNDQLAGKSAAELRIMRNEIYARHGYIFKSEDMRRHFGKEPWYRPLYRDVSSRLTEAEKINIQRIKAHEKRLK